MFTRHGSRCWLPSVVPHPFLITPLLLVASGRENWRRRSLVPSTVALLAHVLSSSVIPELTPIFLLTAVLYFLLQVSFLVDEGVSPVLLQLLSCALCGSKVLAALAASTGSSSVPSSSAPAATSSGQATTQSKSSTKKSKKEEKEKEKEGKSHCVLCVPVVGDILTPQCTLFNCRF